MIRTEIKPEARATWELPKPRPLGGDAFFENPNWRYEINAGLGEVLETCTLPRQAEGENEMKKENQK